MSDLNAQLFNMLFGGQGARPGQDGRQRRAPSQPNPPRSDFGDVAGGGSSTASGVPTGDGQGEGGSDRSNGSGGMYDSQGGFRGYPSALNPGSLWPEFMGPNMFVPGGGVMAEAEQGGHGPLEDALFRLLFTHEGDAY